MKDFGSDAVHQPSLEAQRRANRIDLHRHPTTPAANTLTDQVAEAVARCLDRNRPLGSGGTAALRVDVGMILAGLLAPGLRGWPVEYHASSGGGMWRYGPPCGIGHRRFKQVTDAMERASFVGRMGRPRIKDPATGRLQALAPVMWPTEALEGLARSLGVTADTRKTDWRADATTVAKPRDLPPALLVVCHESTGTERDGIDQLRAEVATINASNDRVTIRGAGRTATLFRNFRHSLSFGGRFYPPVATMTLDDRLRITMNGEPVAEVDVKASQLTVLLGIAGCPLPSGDPYALPGFEREVVKEWAKQTFGGGKPATQWSYRTPPAIRSLSIKAIKTAALNAYPFLNHLPNLVPAAAAAGLPPDKSLGWAAGQWLVQREASILTRAMLTLAGQGIPVLPVHDSLIVPVGSVNAAQTALTGAFEALAGITPRLTVECGASG